MNEILGSFMLNSHIYLYPLPPWIVIAFSVYFSLLVCYRLGICWAHFNLLFKCKLELPNFAWLIANVPNNVCFHFTKLLHKGILYDSGMQSSVIHSIKSDVWFWPFWKPLVSVTNDHFPTCQDYFSFALMFASSPCINSVGPPIFQELFFWWRGRSKVILSCRAIYVHQSVIFLLLFKDRFFTIPIIPPEMYLYICHFT